MLLNLWLDSINIKTFAREKGADPPIEVMSQMPRAGKMPLAKRKDARCLLHYMSPFPSFYERNIGLFRDLAIALRKSSFLSHLQLPLKAL